MTSRELSPSTEKATPKSAATDLSVAEDAMRDFLREALHGRVCTDCGEDLTPGHGCKACAEKHELLRQVFPTLHGDA